MLPIFTICITEYPKPTKPEITKDAPKIMVMTSLNILFILTLSTMIVLCPLSKILYILKGEKFYENFRGSFKYLFLRNTCYVFYYINQNWYEIVWS